MARSGGDGGRESGGDEEAARRAAGRGMEGVRVTAPRARPLPLIYGRPARAGGLRGLRARGPAHVPSRASR